MQGRSALSGVRQQTAVAGGVSRAFRRGLGLTTNTLELDTDMPTPTESGSVASIARSGAIAGIIKLTSAGLSFVMFVAVALVTDARQFGLYSATYAGASLVSFFASIGQPSAVLRFWPQYAAAGKIGVANSFMRRSLAVVFVGLMISSVLIAAFGLVPGCSAKTPEWMPLCFAAAVLAFALAWSEVAASAWRAKNALISALLPRDVIWRALTIGVLMALWAMHLQVDAVTATWLTAGLLLFSVLPQTIMLLRDSVRLPREPLSPVQTAEFRTVTVGLWGATSLPPALGQVSTLLVAAILGPEAAGAIFVADRMTRLVVLALTGLNQALGPEISGACHNGNKEHVQKITSRTALGSSVVALTGRAIFVVFGTVLLSIFDPAYANPQTHLVLIIFGIGALVSSASGPIEPLLQLTGLQHWMVKVLVVVNSVGLAITAFATYEFGAIGAAVSIAATVIAWCVIAVSVAVRQIDIDPSILGLLRLHRSGALGR